MIEANLHEFISIDLPALIATIFVASTAAILGNFLVLRRISLMGDAISHAVLPGIVAGFLVSNSRAGSAIFIGAAIAGILCSLLIEFVSKFGKIDASTSMGVVFSIFFAAGVLLMEQAAASSVDLDADCILYGQLELLFWTPPRDWQSLLTLSTLAELPIEVIVSFLTFVFIAACIYIFFKELKISSFDPGLANALGFNTQLIHYAYMVLVAAAIVSSFQIVGSILVISLLICPAATARLLTDKLNVQIFLSLIIGIFCSISGYYLAAFGPALFSYQNSLSAAGSISVMLGIVFGFALFLAPNYGIVSKLLRNFKLEVKVGAEDILGSIYKLEENTGTSCLTQKQALRIAGGGLRGFFSLKRVLGQKLAIKENENISLLEAGRHIAKNLLRNHQLWEIYLEKYVGITRSHVLNTAEQLEHFTDSKLQKKLSDRVEN
ncbi:MAG: metal ABC transporter permease [Bdellovibrionales bacterium]|nr:metal ABC transporter permease [Bdellovibrionales bacterium]